MTSISSIHTFGDTCTVCINEGGVELWANDGLIHTDELPDLKAAIAFIESVLAERQRGGDYETGRDFDDENHPGTPVTGTLEGWWDDALGSERFGEFTVTSVDGTVVLSEGRHPDADETLTLDRHNLPQLEQALAWAKARLSTTPTPPDQQ